jgi:hypothetical protein
LKAFKIKSNSVTISKKQAPLLARALLLLCALTENAFMKAFSLLKKPQSIREIIKLAMGDEWDKHASKDNLHTVDGLKDFARDFLWDKTDSSAGAAESKSAVPGADESKSAVPGAAESKSAVPGAEKPKSAVADAVPTAATVTALAVARALEVHDKSSEVPSDISLVQKRL